MFYTGAPFMAKNLKKYMGQGDVKRAIMRLGKQMAAELEDKEIFLSAEFTHYTGRIVDFILRKHKLYALAIHWDQSPGATVAYTDGKNIVLNAGNVLACYPKLLEGRFKVNMGILFHECAHKLFLDFEVHKIGLEDHLEKGKLFGKFDVPAGSDLEDNLHELEAVLPNYPKFLTKEYAEVLNIINDGHDEAAMKKCFPGFVAQCINAAGEVQMELSTPLEVLVDKGVAELSIFHAMMLQYAKYGYVNIGETNDATEPYTQLFSRMEPVIDEALQEDDYEARWTYINTLMLLLWPTLRKLMENNKRSDDEMEALAQSLAADAQADNSVAPAPIGSGHSVSPRTIGESQGNGPGISEGGLASIMDTIAKEKATSAVQNDIDREQNDMISNVKFPPIHSGITVDVNRHHNADKAKYEELYKEIEPYVRNLISAMLALLRESNEEAVQHHKRFGPIVEATEAYRPDNAFFAKKKLPEDRPNMSMCILLDESGSMGGTKMEISKKAMIMLERFAAGIGVPLMVAGHYSRGNKVTMNIYTDFVSARPEKDRYALSSIDSHGCNRDGLPIRLCAEMLAERPEEIRLLVVISDGAPNATGYGGEEAFEDIRKTVGEFRRKGLIIYGAAIDDDREEIQNLYGKGFLSITDLKSLPKTMVRLLRQNII